jgi:hypothetical protein
MRLYSPLEEERVHVQGLVREWARAKFITPAQQGRVESDLRVDLRRTNGYLRAALALFTAVIVVASVGFLYSSLGLREPGPQVAMLLGVAALTSLAIAEALIRRFRLYRFGVEEALSMSGVVCAMLTVEELIEGRGHPTTAWEGLPGLVGAAGGFLVYRRFGFVYAAIWGIVSAAVVPFALDLSPTTARALSAAAFFWSFLAARSKRLQFEDGYRGDEYGVIQAAALGGLYLILNLKVTQPGVPFGGAFYWFTFVMIWTLPIIGFCWGIGRKDRFLLAVSFLMALATLLTNKPYLGWARNTWDPIVLGVLLVAGAAGLRRWLTKGPGGERYGFTSESFSEKDRALLGVLGAASLAVQPGSALSRTPSAPTQPAGFDGGQSGGAGGGASF